MQNWGTGGINEQTALIQCIAAFTRTPTPVVDNHNAGRIPARVRPLVETALDIRGSVLNTHVAHGACAARLGGITGAHAIRKTSRCLAIGGRDIVRKTTVRMAEFEEVFLAGIAVIVKSDARHAHAGLSAEGTVLIAVAAHTRTRGAAPIRFARASSGRTIGICLAG